MQKLEEQGLLLNRAGFELSGQELIQMEKSQRKWGVIISLVLSVILFIPGVVFATLSDSDHIAFVVSGTMLISASSTFIIITLVFLYIGRNHIQMLENILLGEDYLDNWMYPNDDTWKEFVKSEWGVFGKQMQKLLGVAICLTILGLLIFVICGAVGANFDFVIVNSWVTNLVLWFVPMFGFGVFLLCGGFCVLKYRSASSSKPFRRYCVLARTAIIYFGQTYQIGPHPTVIEWKITSARVASRQTDTMQLPVLQIELQRDGTHNGATCTLHILIPPNKMQNVQTYIQNVFK